MRRMFREVQSSALMRFSGGPLQGSGFHQEGFVLCAGCCLRSTTRGIVLGLRSLRSTKRGFRVTRSINAFGRRPLKSGTLKFFRILSAEGTLFCIESL